MPYTENDRVAFLRQVATIRDARGLGKSDMLARLFDYLIETSLDGRSPKEVEVADAVFARGESFDAMQDASVRVYVHRLRKKLEEFYAGPGADEPWRLVMLKGEYRLVVERVEATAAIEPVASPPMAPRGRRRWLPALIAGFLAVLAVPAVWFLLRPDQPDRDMQAVRESVLWGPVVASGQPIVVVLGDYYIFGEKGGGGQVKRLVREFAINSRYALDEHMMLHPELNNRYVDMGLRYYPIGVASALRDILPVLRTAGRRVHQVRVIPASDLTPDMLRISNIVYIGYLSGLGALRNPVFNGSNFAVGTSYDELIDKRTGRMAAATTADPGNNPEQDFGYISRFPGPNGTSIVIVAGTRDAAMMQAADFATQRGSVEGLRAWAKDPDAFEALLRVDTLGDQNLGGKLLSVSPINRGAVWRPVASQRFPDDGRAAPGG